MLGCSVLAAIAAGVAVWVARPAAPDPAARNVVFVMTCTTRKDQLTPYGGPAETTPFLAELADRGTRFTDAIAASSWTKESSAALFSGRFAHAIGMTDPGHGLGKRRLSDEIETLAERLSAGGWYTVGVTANPHLNEEYG